MSVGKTETVRRYDLPITIVDFSNASFGRIKAGQRFCFRKRHHSADFSRTDHATVAAVYVIRSWSVEDPGDIKPALAAALDHNGSAPVDLITQPREDADEPVIERVAQKRPEIDI